MVTSTALGLNDCEVFARRAYFLVYFGLAATFFSTVLVLISPHANSFGFTASAAALSAAFVFGLGYLVSYRLLLCKATTMQKARSEEGRFPGADGDPECAEHWNADPLVS